MTQLSNKHQQFYQGEAVYQDTLGGGCHWSMRVKKGTVITFTDLHGGANLGLLMFNPYDLLEKYNAPDTLKCQHTFKLTQGHCLYSDMGRIFASVVADDCGWHDTVCGNINKTMVAEKWGIKTYQEARNGWTQNGYDSFLVEFAKYGLSRKDMAANLNLFSQVQTDDLGNMRYIGDASKAGNAITLRFEMDTLLIMHTCPHPLNNATEYPVRPVHYHLGRAAAIASDDECKNHCAENQRGFHNNFLYNFCEA